MTTKEINAIAVKVCDMLLSIYFHSITMDIVSGNTYLDKRKAMDKLWDLTEE